MPHRPSPKAAGGRLAAAALGAVLPLALLTSAPTNAASDPEPGTLTASLEVLGEGGGRDVVVTTEPASGRVEVSPYYWATDDGGRYLHVGLGTSDGGRCEVVRWVVVDTTDLAASAAYDATGAPLPETEQLDVPVEWADQVARVGIAPFPAVDCVRANSHDSADPAHHGPRIWSGRPRALTPIGWDDVPGSFPASVTCPWWIPWNQQFDLNLALLSEPGTYPPAGVIPHPSRLTSFAATVEPGAFSVADSPALPDDVDLWADPSWLGAFVLDADEDAVHGIRLRGTVTRDGTTTEWSCGMVRVSMPAPTGWTGSLAGTTWWLRGTSSNSGIGEYRLHRTYEFLDDAWVFVDGEYAGARTKLCRTVDHHWPVGCHHYYYDEATGRLQIDDRRAKTRAGGWLLPDIGNKYASYSSARVVLPVDSDQRFGYRGTSGSGSLQLRHDGTYRYHGRQPDGDSKVSWSGTYRFVGGDVQQVVLRHGRRTFRDEVQLYYRQTDEGRTLVDLDTHHRVFRFRMSR